MSLSVSDVQAALAATPSLQQFPLDLLQLVTETVTERCEDCHTVLPLRVCTRDRTEQFRWITCPNAACQKTAARPRFILCSVGACLEVVHQCTVCALPPCPECGAATICTRHPTRTLLAHGLHRRGSAWLCLQCSRASDDPRVPDWREELPRAAKATKRTLLRSFSEAGPMVAKRLCPK